MHGVLGALAVPEISQIGRKNQWAAVLRGEASDVRRSLAIRTFEVTGRSRGLRDILPA